MSFISPPESSAPAPELLSSVDGFEAYEQAINEKEAARKATIALLQERYGDLVAMRARLVALGEDTAVAELDDLMLPEKSPNGELESWLQDNPIESDAIFEAEAKYRLAWEKIIETVKKWGKEAIEIVESIAAGAIQVLKLLPKTTLIIALALLVLGGSVYGGLELLKLAEWGGFEMIKNQLTALLGEGFIDWENFQSILPDLHKFFGGLSESGEIGGGEFLGKPIG